jgi:hypothetical protein
LCAVALALWLRPPTSVASGAYSSVEAAYMRSLGALGAHSFVKAAYMSSLRALGASSLKPHALVA